MNVEELESAAFYVSAAMALLAVVTGYAGWSLIMR